MPLTAGTRFGPYEIAAPLGAGGMGEVYRARDTRLGREVAVKVLPERFAEDRAALARFEREARAIATLSHPNILAIFDVGREGDVAYSVTELLEGETLRQRLGAGPLSVRKTADYGAQIGRALAAAHAKGIVHRDLKPDNVFIAPDGRVKVLDFGLAKQEQSAPEVDLNSPTRVDTQAGMVVGTPSYMSPEQARGEPVDARTDIFALGVVLFEMLTGRRAFEGESAVEIMAAVLKQEPPDVSTLDPAIPPAFGQLVRHCIEKQPGERFQSASDVAFNLQLLASTATPSGVQAAPSGPTHTPRRARRIRPVVLVLAAIGLAAVALFGFRYAAARSASAMPVFEQKSYRQKAIFRAAFAPDRQTIIYSAATQDNVPELVTLMAEWPTSRPVGVPASHLLSISSRGELALLTHARVVTENILRGTLARMPLGSTTPREVLENVREAAWSPDGATLAIVRFADGKDRLEFPAGRTLYESTGYLSDLRVSPDGNELAFFEHPIKWEDAAALIVLDGTSKQRKVVTSVYPFTAGVAWATDGREVVFGASNSAVTNTALYAVGLDGRNRLALETAGSLIIHDIAPDGRWLVARDDYRRGLMARGRGADPAAATEHDLTWLDRSDVAAVSGDGSTILFSEFAASAGLAGSVCLRTLDGSSVVQLGDGTAQDLSPDGKLALAIDHTSSKLLLYPTGAGTKRELERGGLDQLRYANWFADGRRVMVCGTEAGKPSRCYVQDITGGAPRPVTPDGDWGIPSPDGTRAVVWRADNAPVVYALDQGAAQTIPSVGDDDVPLRWSLDGQSIFFYQPGRVPGQVDRVELASGLRSTVRRFEAPRDAIGVLSLDPVVIGDDQAASYAYTYTRQLSTLFVVKGVR
jgi:eukaryotic-like serine/threonine-protein kinase